MATKNNIRSIRFSDELAQMIDLQPGRTFTEKFEALITKCCWELPGKEKELEEINKQIAAKQQELNELWKSCREWRGTLQAINSRIIALENVLHQEAEERNL